MFWIEKEGKGDWGDENNWHRIKSKRNGAREKKTES